MEKKYALVFLCLVTIFILIFIFMNMMFLSKPIQYNGEIIFDYHFYESDESIAFGKELNKVFVSSKSKEDFLLNINEKIVKANESAKLFYSGLYIYDGELAYIGLDNYDELIVVKENETFKIKGDVKGYYISDVFKENEVVIFKLDPNNEMYIFKGK